MMRNPTWLRRAFSQTVVKMQPMTRHFSQGPASMQLDPSMGIVLEQLLRTVGTDRDVDQYLTLYGKMESQKFAVIKVGGEVIQRDLDTFACALTFLHRAGLFPIVIHGAGPQMNEVLEKDGYVPQYEGGMRVTDEYTLRVARRVFLETNLTLVDRLQSLRTPARPISSGVFEAEVLDPKIGFVGNITNVHKHAIIASINAGCLPILAPLAESKSGQILNINADVAAREVSLAFQPHKTIMINAKGGWVEPDGRKLSIIDMEQDYEEFLNRDYTGRQGTLLKLKELKLMLDNLPDTATIALTSPSGLVKELFTHRGAGTLVTKGEKINSYSSVSAAGGEGVLGALLSQSFGQQKFDSNFATKGHLHPHYWARLKEANSLLKIYCSASKSAAAVLADGVQENGKTVNYLCKFAVTERGIGNGTGSALWARIVADQPEGFFWRSHSESAINSWFFEKCSGSAKVQGSAPWIVFWYSKDKLPPTLVDKLVLKCEAVPRSYVDNEEFKALTE
mmetsp:Transcript_40105/g.78835  ORF Transcript_40105/g.78835 Transcript_40105/m.78835 type:complete len:507 (-) Transcript_40105:155-1675(-)